MAEIYVSGPRHFSDGLLASVWRCSPDVRLVNSFEPYSTPLGASPRQSAAPGRASAHEARRPEGRRTAAPVSPPGRRRSTFTSGLAATHTACARGLERRQPQLFGDARQPEPARAEALHSARHEFGAEKKNFAAPKS